MGVFYQVEEMKWQKIRIRHCFHLHVLDYNLYSVMSCLWKKSSLRHEIHLHRRIFLNVGNRVMITRERERERMQRKKWRDATENGWVERLFAVNYP